MKLYKTRAEALEIVGGLSKTSKMPCHSWGTPAFECNVGSVLREVAGSTCEGCYAAKGRCAMPNATGAQYRRLEALNDLRWVPAMIHLIKPMPYFRWMCTGDLIGQAHLDKIIQVCEATPGTRHWLPTREAKLIKRNLERIPKNLVIRLSAAMVDGLPPKSYRLTSTVHRGEPAVGTACPAVNNGGECGDCRMCWDRRRRNISYSWH